MTMDARVMRFLVRLFSTAWFWIGLIAVTLAGIFVWELLHESPMRHVNSALWIITNLVLFFGYIVLVFFVVLYGLIFEWRRLPDGSPNIGGQQVFQLMASLASLVLLLAVQIFLVPPSGRPWWIEPPETVVWLPTLRFLVDTSIVVAVTRMAGRLVRNIITATPVEISVSPRRPVAPATVPPPDADAPDPASTRSAPPAGD